MKKTLFTLIASFALASCSQITKPEPVQVTEHDSVQNGHIIALADEVNHLHKRIDSVNAANLQLARLVLRHDSLIGAKSEKAQRRENTGRFIGGILKGLIPGL
jgi:hypothetical protein